MAPQGQVTAGSCHYPRPAGRGVCESGVWRGPPHRSFGFHQDCSQPMVTHLKGAEENRQLDFALLPPSDFLSVFPIHQAQPEARRARKSIDTAHTRQLSRVQSRDKASVSTHPTTSYQVCQCLLIVKSRRCFQFF